MGNLIAGDRALLPGVEGLVPGWVEIEGGVIVAAGQGAPPRAPDEVASTLAPGYVDVHSHGGGGAAFGTDDPADVETVLATHRAKGTTTMVASLVTGTIDTLAQQVALLAGFVEDGKLAGIHLEGPWLSAEHKGAHPEHLLCDPSPADVTRLLDAGRGGVRMITLAPERDGALAAIAASVARGCVAAVGHTAAGFETVEAAIDAGATGATHLFNGMPEMTHRTPGPVLALWRDSRVWLELVCDGVHVDPRLIAHVMATAPGRAVFVTDAMAAAGAQDGDYMLGELAVEVRGGVARLAEGGSIAGSTLTLDRAVRTAVGAGVPVADALRAATVQPARYLGLSGVGALAPGCRADVVDLDGGLNVTRVMVAGRWQ